MLIEEWLSLWEVFYKKIFNVRVISINYLKQVPIPEHKEGFEWLNFMIAITADTLIYRCDGLFGAQQWTSYKLDAVLDQTKSIRKPTDDAYAFWVAIDDTEPDQKLRNISANHLNALGINGITLEERLLLEIFYWWKTGQHLDHWFRTLCFGSRYKNKGVPIVGWDSNNDRLWVDCHFFPDQVYDRLCGREVVSVPKISWPEIGISRPIIN